MNMDVYALAHEVKNPLCVVKGYLEMLKEGNVDKYKGVITEELNNSIGILNSYLEYKKLVVNMELMDLNVLLLDIKKSMKGYMRHKGVSLVIKNNDDDIYLMGDYSKLKQVFSNIIKNGMEAFAKNIVIDYEIVNNKVMINITNDGLNIMDDDLSKIGTNYTSKVIGNGIGVNLCKKIVKLHHGKIKYKNNISGGISVFITLLLD